MISRWAALALLLASPALGVQYARPNGGGWSSGSATDIDEDSPGDGSVAAQIGATTDECESSTTETNGTFSSVTDPVSSTGHVLRWECTQTGDSGVIILKSGSTTIVTVSGACNGATETYTLSAGEANAITDYTALNIVFSTSLDDTAVCSCAGGCAYGASIDFIQLEVPDASGGGAARRVVVVQ